MGLQLSNDERTVLVSSLRNYITLCSRQVGLVEKAKRNDMERDRAFWEARKSQTVALYQKVVCDR